MKRIDRFNVGDKAEWTRTITNKDIKKFAELTGDDNPIHTDSDFAAKTPLKKVVAHGMLSASFISTIIGKRIPGKGALWISQNLKFLQPVKAGEKLTVSAEVTKKNSRRGVLTLKTAIKNQNKQLVVTGESLVKVLEFKEDEPLSFGATPAQARLIEQDSLQARKPDKSGKKVVLITGASRGIGEATAVCLAKNGYSVAVNYRLDRSGAMDVVERIRKSGGEAIACGADVKDSASVKDMVSKIIKSFGTITALVNNASGGIIPKDFESLEWKDVQSHIDTQIKGSFNCVKAVMDEFLRNGFGSVINVGSINSDGNPAPKLIDYTLAKSALQSFTRSLALEYGPRGIRFNMVSPGMTDTGLISEFSEKSRLMTTMQTPLRKIAKPEDIAGAIAFLLSDDAKHVTGETLRVCGGYIML